MTTLLYISSSLFGDQGQSSQLSDRFVADWRRDHPEGRVIRRDLAAAPVPHLDATAIGGFMADPADRVPAQQAAVALSEELIGELQAADVIVLGLPMYNFGIPSTLKAWIDHVARAGITFRYTEKGPEGLLTGKRAYIFAARGGLYEGTANDSQTPYIRQILGFMGITDVKIVAAEGLNMGDDAKTAALAAARARIDALSETRTAAA